MKRVILATDGSDCAQEAGEFLARFPYDEGCELTVLTAIDTPYPSRSYSTPDRIEKAIEAQKALAEKAFKSIKQLFAGTTVTVGQIVREGAGDVVIVQVAKEQAADLIVLGARGHSVVSRLMLGSTSDFVATHAHCSVLVVRPTPARESDRPLRISIGYEETGAARAALEEFAESRWGRQAEVDVVSVVSFVDGFMHEIEVDPEEAKKAANEAVQTALVQLQVATPQATAHLVESSHVGEGLVLFAEDHQCDLVVVGETPRNFLGRILLGSVSRFVLRHAPCSVWITRNRVLRRDRQVRS